MSGRSGHVRQFPTSKAQIAYSARFLNYPGKAKRESCKKKAHNDGHVPHKRKRNYPAQKVVQQMVERNVRNKAEDRRSDLAGMASIAINRSAI